MLLETEGGIWAKADATVFRLLMDGGRTERRLLAAGRTIDMARHRVAALRRRQDGADARAYATAAREVEREFAATWGKTVRVRVPYSGARKAVPNDGGKRRAALSSGTSARAIRAYKAPLLDARGRVALYFRIRYIGLKSKDWRPGLAAAHVFYILRETALENGAVGLDVVMSNMGKDADEIAACFNALEAMEEGYRANAKIQYRIVWNLPHDLDARQRHDMVESFCERTFGRAGLPWVAAIHVPDERGNQKNYHAHICFSTRPCERTGDHEWNIAQEKVNGLTDPDGLKLMRALAAGRMNTACGKAGLAVRFTHQTYKERKIDAQRQAHVGPAAMALHERGESVAVIERNARIVERNELAVERDTVARQAALTERLVTMMKRAAESASEIRRVATMWSLIDRIGARASVLAHSRRPKAPTVGRVAAVGDIARRSQAIRQRILSRPAPSVSAPAVTRVNALSAIAGNLQAWRQQQHRQRSELASTRARMADVQGRIETRNAFILAEAQEAAQTALMGAKVRPYSIRDDKIVLDLSAMNAADVMLVRALDRDTLIATVRERYRLDRDADAAEARDREHAAEQRRRADEERARKIEIETVRALAMRVAEADRFIAEGAQWLAEQQAAQRAIDQLPAAGAGGPQVTSSAAPVHVVVATPLPNTAAAPAETIPAAVTITTALENLRRRDDWIGPADHGFYTPGNAVLAAIGLDLADLDAPAVQAGVMAIYEDQMDRLDPVVDDFKQAARFRIQRGAVVLDERFSEALRNDVVRWDADPRFKSFVTRTWRDLRVNPAVPAERPIPAANPVTTIAQAAPTIAVDRWSQAASVRQRAMAEWDAVERSDTVDGDRPGRVHARPGQTVADEVDKPVTPDRPRSRLHPGMFPGSGGIGG